MREREKWHKLVSRKASTLAAGNVIMSYLHASFKKLVDIDFEFSEFCYVNSEVYIRKQDFFKLLNKIQNRVRKDPEFIKWVIERNHEQCKRLLEAAEIDNSDLRKKSAKELKVLFERYVDESYNMGPFWIAPFAIERVATEIISKELKAKLGRKRKEKFKEYFSVLTSPSKEGYTGEEREKFLKIASAIQKLGYDATSPSLRRNLEKKKDLWRTITAHVANYAWLNTQFMLGKPWTVDDFILRLNYVSNAEEKLKEHQGIRLKTERELKRVIRELRLSAEVLTIINAVREYVFLRTYRKDIMNMCDYKIRPLLSETGRRFGFSFKEMICHSNEEIYDLQITGKKLKKAVIRERMEDFAILAEKKKLKVISGKALRMYKKTWGEEEFAKDVEKLQGRVASKGFVKGRVRIIIDKKQITNLQKGEVLVATMTTPDFVPAMQKAIGIVTDEGGILCHAAIVSRELGKACVIGTQVATKVLKDGDLVEVNANKGVVRRLDK